MPERVFITWVKPVGWLFSCVGINSDFYAATRERACWVVDRLMGYGQFLRSSVQVFFHSFRCCFLSVRLGFLPRVHNTNNKRLLGLNNLVINYGEIA